jgi:thiamine pyrophosphokinase
MHAVIFAGGTIHAGEPVSRTIASADLIIAADGGAANALAFGCTPSIIVGDLDSLDPALLEQFEQQADKQIIRLPVEKDETDTEIAIQVALNHHADTITLLGGLGGQRFDHSIANIFLLVGFAGINLRLVDGMSTCWLLSGPGQANITGHKRDLLSLFPLERDALNVHTTNLYYPLRNEPLRFGKPRGISNQLTDEQAEVSLDAGLLLIIHTQQ